MGTDIYVPSLPAISHAFHISTTLAQTSVAIYILGYGVGQLIVGPISDHYGRRPIVIIGFLGRPLVFLGFFLSLWNYCSKHFRNASLVRHIALPPHDKKL